MFLLYPYVLSHTMMTHSTSASSDKNQSSTNDNKTQLKPQKQWWKQENKEKKIKDLPEPLHFPKKKEKRKALWAALYTGTGIAMAR